MVMYVTMFRVHLRAKGITVHTDADAGKTELCEFHLETPWSQMFINEKITVVMPNGWQIYSEKWYCAYSVR